MPVHAAKVKSQRTAADVRQDRHRDVPRVDGVEHREPGLVSSSIAKHCDEALIVGESSETLAVASRIAASSSTTNGSQADNISGEIVIAPASHKVSRRGEKTKHYNKL
jgi:hypothetical protein